MNWTTPFDRGTGTIRRGRGIGIALKAVISPTTSVRHRQRQRATEAARCSCGTVDMGQGSDTAMAQIVAEVLDIPAEAVQRRAPATPT